MKSSAKPTSKSKTMPAKKLPPSKKAAPVTAAKTAAPAKKAAQRDIEDKDDGVLDLANVLAGCPTEAIVDGLLRELSKRVDYIIAEMEENPELLPETWLQVKRLEQHATNVRRAIEDALVEVYPVDEDDEEALEATATHEMEGFEIKIAHKLTRKVDADKLTELSEEYEIDDDIARIFRFKPELNLAVYRAESDEMREFFDPVITTTPSRPSFTITPTSED